MTIKKSIWWIALRKVLLIMVLTLGSMLIVELIIGRPIDWLRYIVSAIAQLVVGVPIFAWIEKKKYD